MPVADSLSKIGDSDLIFALATRFQKDDLIYDP